MVKMKLGSIASVITKGTTPTTLGYAFVDEGINFVKIESITENGEFLPEKFAHITSECDQKLSRSQLQHNDLLFSIAGAIGRTAIVTEEILPANTNQAIAIIRVPEGVIDYSYLKYVLQSPGIAEQFNKRKQGVAQLNISLKDIGDFEIPIYNIEEQQKIVVILDKISELIAQRKEQLAKLDQLVKARFVEMFGTVENNRFRIKTVKIKDACDLINGKAFKPEDWSDTGLPIVRIQNLNNEQAPFNYFEGVIKEQYLIDSGELLFSWSGTPGTSFGAFFWNRGKAVLNQHIFRVKPKLDFDIFFLQFALNGRIDSIISKAHGGVGLQHITKKELDEVELLQPTIDRQNEFAFFVEQTNKTKLTIQSSLDKLEVMKKALMQEYFG